MTTLEMKSSPSPAAAAAGSSPFATIPEALDELRAGRFLIVLDDEDRENEGDLILPAECATESALAFMVNHTSGVICVGAPGDRLDALKLPPMVSDNEDPKCTAFTVTVDYSVGTSTGISAHDRALTIRKLADPSVRPDEFTRPGHIFPLRARAGGVLERAGHTEASVDLARLAGYQPLGFLSEIVKRDGSMMRRPGLERLSAEHGIKMITIEALQQYRRDTEQTAADKQAAECYYYRADEKKLKTNKQQKTIAAEPTAAAAAATLQTQTTKKNDAGPPVAVDQTLPLIAVASLAAAIGSVVGFVLGRR